MPGYKMMPMRQYKKGLGEYPVVWGYGFHRSFICLHLYFCVLWRRAE